MQEVGYSKIGRDQVQIYSFIEGGGLWKTNISITFSKDCTMFIYNKEITHILFFVGSKTLINPLMN